jgi:hypothetical protein
MVRAKHLRDLPVRRLRLQLLDALGDLLPLAGDDLEAVELDGVEEALMSS